VRGDSDNWRILNGDPSAASSEFQDNGPRGKEAFLLDVKKAITENRYAPAWEDFIECLTSGDVQDFDSFGQDEEEDFDSEEEDGEEEDEFESDEEGESKLESFQSFINKRK
jgi:hypothetical protein